MIHYFLCCFLVPALYFSKNYFESIQVLAIFFWVCFSQGTYGVGSRTVPKYFCISG